MILTKEEIIEALNERHSPGKDRSFYQKVM